MIIYPCTGNAGSAFVEVLVSNTAPNAESGGHVIQVLIPTNTFMKQNESHTQSNRIRIIGTVIAHEHQQLRALCHARHVTTVE